MSRFVLVAMILIAVICIVAGATYLYFAKREERKLEERKLEHEREMNLDQQAFGYDEDPELDDLLDDKE